MPTSGAGNGEGDGDGEPSAGSRRGSLVAGLIAACVERPGLVVVLVLGLAAFGYHALLRTPLDALPDLSDTQVILVTEWPGQSPDRVEQQITYPISSALLSAPRVRAVRGQSSFGISFVYVIFEDGTDPYWARSRVLEYLSAAQAGLPEGVRPTLGPDATGVGWVFQYALRDRTGAHDLAALRALQDWNVRYALASVPGVAEVAPLGGYVKQYQIQLDPERLRAYGVTVPELAMAVRDSNRDAGGHVIELAGHEHMIRGRGYLESTEDLERIAIRPGPAGAAVRVGDVATVTLGPDTRRGLAELNGEGEVVGGVVVMRYGENALRVIDAVKERIEEVKKSLPEGVELVITYDRSELIRASVDTLQTALIEQIAIVVIMILVFLMHVRSTLVPAIVLPLATLLAFIPMMFQGITANIMSLGGIAVAIGEMADASIVLVENVHKRLERWQREGSLGSRKAVVVSAMQEVGPSIFYSLLVLTVSFVPVFALEGAEGRLFRPLALTKTYSMAFGALLAITLTPALIALLLRGPVPREDSNPLNRMLVRLYSPVVRFVVDHRVLVPLSAVVLLVLTIPAWLRLGNEFMPPLNEGAILYMPTAPDGMSVTEAARVLKDMDARIKKVPEVVSVFGKMGRAESATDPAPIGMAETVIVLQPKERWREGLTWDGLVMELDQKLQYPGMPNVFWMPIQTRTEMLSTGVRSPLGIQVFGDDLEEIERAALQIERAVKRVQGTRSAFAERSTGGFYLDVVIDRDAVARYGLRVGDVQDTVSTAIGGMSIGETVEGRARFPIQVRYAREYRDDPTLLERVLIATPSGAQIPLSYVAKLENAVGPPMIRSEGGKLVGFVFVDTDRSIAEYVEDAKAVVASEVKLPSGVRLSWTGQFRHFESAKERLLVVVPFTLLIVILLVYWNTQSVVATGIVMLAVPFSLIGAAWLLYFLQYDLSVAVWVGLIALAGLDAETGIVMLLYLTLSHDQRRRDGALRSFADLREAIVDGAARRIRPKLMTVLTTMIGLMPILWSTGTGADVMKRIAAPVVGGAVSSFLLELLVYPAVFALWKQRGLSSIRRTVR